MSWVHVPRILVKLHPRLSCSSSGISLVFLGVLGCMLNCVGSGRMCTPEGLTIVDTPLKPEGVALEMSPRMRTGRGLLSSIIVSPFQNNNGSIKGRILWYGRNLVRTSLGLFLPSTWSKLMIPIAIHSRTR